MARKTKKFIFKEDELAEELLPLLKEKVFHVTPFENYVRIKKEGKIKNNRDGAFPFASGMKQYYARNRALVPLFDLRNKSEKDINEGLRCDNFLTNKKRGNHVVYLILDRKTYSEILDTKETMNAELSVNRLECWYRDFIDLENISEMIEVVIKRRKLEGLAAILSRLDKKTWGKAK